MRNFTLINNVSNICIAKGVKDLSHKFYPKKMPKNIKISTPLSSCESVTLERFPKVEI